MSISFIRVDDRMIHGQTCTRWALEYPCDGIIAVNNAAAKNPVLKSAYKSASGKKTFVWGLDEFIAKSPKVLASKDNYFLITKNPVDMEKILVEKGFNRLKIGGRMLMVTKRRDWYRNKLAAIFGGVRVREIDGYFVFEAEKRQSAYAMCLTDSTSTNQMGSAVTMIVGR